MDVCSSYSIFSTGGTLIQLSRVRNTSKTRQTWLTSRGISRRNIFLCTSSTILRQKVSPETITRNQMKKCMAHWRMLIRIAQTSRTSLSRWALQLQQRILIYKVNADGIRRFCDITMTALSQNTFAASWAVSMRKISAYSSQIRPRLIQRLNRRQMGYISVLAHRRQCSHLQMSKTVRQAIRPSFDFGSSWTNFWTTRSMPTTCHFPMGDESNSLLMIRCVNIAKHIVSN